MALFVLFSLRRYTALDWILLLSRGEALCSALQLSCTIAQHRHFSMLLWTADLIQEGIMCRQHLKTWLQVFTQKGCMAHSFSSDFTEWKKRRYGKCYNSSHFNHLLHLECLHSNHTWFAILIPGISDFKQWTSTSREKMNVFRASDRLIVSFVDFLVSSRIMSVLNCGRASNMETHFLSDTISEILSVQVEARTLPIFWPNLSAVVYTSWTVWPSSSRSLISTNEFKNLFWA